MLSQALDTIHGETPLDCVVHGAAPGADTLADTWARSRGIKVERYYALWKTYGLGAGAIRNQKMLDDGKPDIVIAFPGGPGTADMIRRALKARVPVKRVS